MSTNTFCTTLPVRSHSLSVMLERDMKGQCNLSLKKAYKRDHGSCTDDIQEARELPPGAPGLTEVLELRDYWSLFHGICLELVPERRL